MVLAGLLAGGVSAQQPAALSQAEFSTFPTGVGRQRQESYSAAPAPVWRSETVDPGSVGQYSSLALDTLGWPHISYYDFLNDDLKYAYKDGTGWHIQVVDGTGYVGAYTSLALDSLNRPHISYCSCTDQTCTTCNDLKYAWHDGTAWHIEPLDTTGDVGGYTSLALVADQPHSSYYDFGNGDLKYAYKDGTGWHIQVVDGTGADVGLYTSLAVDAGQRHISYLDNTNQHLKYALYDGSNWSTQTLDSGPNAGYYTSLDLCRTYTPGAPRITYYGGGELKYAHKYFFSGWATPVTLDSVPPGPTSLALDSNCQVHVSYFETYNGDLRYTYEDISGWHTETVDDNGDVWPYWTSLALDAAGLPHISYYNDSPAGLSYAYKVYAVYLPLVLRST
jgi:hypothetical protein